MTSFKNRLLILIVSLVALAQGVTMLLALGSIRGALQAESARQLVATRSMLDRTLATRARMLSLSGEVLARDDAFRKAIASADPATIESVLANHARRVSAGLAVLYTPEGAVTAANVAGLARQASQSLRLPAEGAESAGFALVGGRPWQVVFVPVKAPLVVAWVALGFELDARLAAQLAALGGTEVNFVYQPAGAPAAVLSTLAAPSMPSAPALLSLPAASTEGGGVVSLAGRAWFAQQSALDAQGGALRLVVLRSQDAAMAPFRGMRYALLLIGGLALGGAVLVAVLAGRSAVRPLGVLVNAARQVQRGVYCEHIEVHGAEEFQHLAGTFNAMQEGIREREARLIHQASHDALTDLPNREGLRQLMAGGEFPGPWSVALLDVHRFRDVNASLGHHAGDALLRALGLRLGRDGHGQWHCARIGGDQFALLAPLHDSELMHRLLVVGNELRDGIDAGGVRQSVDLHVGIAEWRAPRVAPDDLLRQADVALLQAKEQGQEAVAYQAAHDSEHQRRVLLVAELRRALAGQGLSLHYQPLVAMTDRAPVACEALLRWNHATLGAISPAEFVPLAERASVLPELSRWVLGEAIGQLGAWHRAGIDLEIAVNLSAADFADGGLASRVLALLRQHGAPAHRLLLEVTESAIMREPQLAAQVMQQLRRAGVRFAIDDFGTGHSSLAQLHALPVDELKIDRAFVRELEQTPSNQAIVRTTVELGHSLGLKVVAEGIETPATWAALLRLGCDIGQGYLISRPMPAADLPAWHARQRGQVAAALSEAGSAGMVTALRRPPA